LTLGAASSPQAAEQTNQKNCGTAAVVDVQAEK
jgi:hypothetical protein